MKRYSAFVIFPILIALVYSPIEVPFTLDTVAQVLPVRQWVLTHTLNGALNATFYDHRTGLVRKQEGFQFDNGDLVQMRFDDEWKAGKLVRSGETVATVASSKLSEQLVQLRNELLVEQANLSVVASGQKPQIIAQLEEEISLAKADVELRQKALERNKKLQADGLIAALAVEQAENAVHEAQARVRMAEKSLAISASGEKQEMVGVTNSRIASLQKQIEFLEQKRKQYVIAAPFAGEVRLENSAEGDRLYVEDTSAVVISIPVRLRDLQYITVGQEIELQFQDNADTVFAKVAEIGNRIDVISYEQAVTVRAIAEKNVAMVATNLPMRCSILCGKVRMIEFLRRSVRWQM